MVSVGYEQPEKIFIPTAGQVNVVYEARLTDEESDAALLVSQETINDLTAPTLERPEALALNVILARIKFEERSHFENGHDFSADKWSVCIVKPDAKQLELDEKIYGNIGDKNLTVAAAKNAISLNEESLGSVWPPYVDGRGSKITTPWWEAMVEYMTDSPVDMVLVHGNDASQKMKALKNELRKDQYGDGYQDDESLPWSERVKSIIHSSDRNSELFVNAYGFWSHSDLARAVKRARENKKLSNAA